MGSLTLFNWLRRSPNSTHDRRVGRLFGGLGGRIVALLLVPCLAGDALIPAGAATFGKQEAALVADPCTVVALATSAHYQQSALPVPFAPSSEPEVFQDQAFAVVCLCFGTYHFLTHPVHLTVSHLLSIFETLRASGDSAALMGAFFPGLFLRERPWKITTNAATLEPSAPKPLPIKTDRVLYIQDRLQTMAEVAAQGLRGRSQPIPVYHVKVNETVTLPAEIKRENVVLLHSIENYQAIIVLRRTLQGLRTQGADSVTLVNTYGGYARQGEGWPSLLDAV